MIWSDHGRGNIVKVRVSDDSLTLFVLMLQSKSFWYLLYCVLMWGMWDKWSARKHFKHEVKRLAVIYEPLIINIQVYGTFRAMESC